MVNSVPLNPSTLISYISFKGHLQPEGKDEIFAEMKGELKIATKPFKIGLYYNKDELKTRLFASESRASLISQ